LSAAPKLQRLADRIGTAVTLARDAMALEIKAALQDATTMPDWLPPERRRASHENYARHLLYGDPDGRFSILSIVWDHGQMSPIHGHYCWCAVGVYQGELTERYYREGAAGGPPVLVSSTQRGPGTLSFEPAASGIHRIANESSAVAISLHVYGIAKDSISTGVNRVYV
jgi:predicted metal-dependent enzyme (double-stranded beta helix superfamily)